MDLYYATGNLGKFHSLVRELEPKGIKVVQRGDLEILEPRKDDVQEIAKVKVREAYRILEKPVVANDVGFYISSLRGYPGAFVHLALDKIEVDGILKLVHDKERECEFRECIAYLDEKLEEPKCFTSHDKGRLAYEPRGTIKKYHKSDLALIFIPDGSEKTLAEMTHDEFIAWRKESREESSPSRLFTNWFINHWSLDTTP